MTPPKAFISYSWSSPDHQQWVLDLATQLRESGVDVIFDKWDLKEGDDAIAFMESIVTDDSIEKVIIVLDRVYAEKADDRKGGVGTETQIITPHIYKKVRNQNKFVCVISETDAEGKPYLPAFYQSRLYIDLSEEEIFAENLEHLLRWIFNRPAYPKPQVGKPPAFLDETTVLLPTRSRAKRAIDHLQKGSDVSNAALADYLETLSESLESLRLDGSTPEPFDQAVVDSIDTFLPYRDEYIHVISVLARHNPKSQQIATIKRFFERVLVYCFPPPTMNSYRSDSFDNYKFILHELFLYTVAIFTKHQCFSSVDELVRGGFYLGNLQQFLHDPMQGPSIFYQNLVSMDVRKKRLSLNRTSLQADMLKERSKNSGIVFEDLMQADFVLFVRDAADAVARGTHNRWYPTTLVFTGYRSLPFEIFARARSASYFLQIAPMLGVSGLGDLADLLDNFGKGTGLYLPRWSYDTLSPGELMGSDKLGSLA